MRFLIPLLFSLAWAGGRAHAQTEQVLALDSVRRLPDDTAKLRAYVDVAQVLNLRGGSERARAFLLEAEGLAAALLAADGPTPATSEYAQTLSWAHWNVRAYGASLERAREAYALADALDDEDDRARASRKLASAYNRLGHVDSAAAAALESHRRYLRLGRRGKAALLLVELSEIYADLDDRTTALDYSRQAYEMSTGTTEPWDRNTAAKRFGRNLLDYGAVDSAAALADTVLHYARLTGSNRRISSALGYLASVLKAQDRYAEAEAVYDEMRQYRNGKLSEAQTINYASMLARMGRGREARDTLLHGMQVYEAVRHNPDNLLSIYSTLSLVDLSGPAYDSARAYVRKHRALQDSLREAGTRDRVLELEEQYAAAERRAQIALQESELRTQRRTLWLVGTLLLLALAAVAAVWRLARRLRAKSRENEYLVKEIHHRVKNNLQVLASLLSLQGRHLRAPSDARAAAAVTEARTRVEAMGLIHRQLYADAHSMSAVEMPAYLRDLGETILDTFDAPGFDVDIVYDVADVSLETDRAIPLGLIVNELVTNSLKYAFAPGERGTVTIALQPRGRGRLALTVTDDGRGSSGEGVSAGGTGFGGSLIGLFAEKLGGEVRVLEMAGAGYGTEVVMGV